MEIKFRAYNKQTGKMMAWKDIKTFGNLSKLLTLSFVKVMQFTGLKDSEGKEIYEGDILDFDEREWGAMFLPEVIEMDKIIGNWEYCGSLSDVKEWRKVIGNVHEDPDIIVSDN